jgi:hypothetical protein
MVHEPPIDERISVDYVRPVSSNSSLGQSMDRPGVLKLKSTFPVPTGKH